MSPMSVRTAETLRRAKRWRKPSSTVVSSRFARGFGGALRAEFAWDRGAAAHEVERLPRGPHIVHANDRRAFAHGVERGGDRSADARRRGRAGVDPRQKRLAA